MKTVTNKMRESTVTNKMRESTSLKARIFDKLKSETKMTFKEFTHREYSENRLTILKGLSVETVSETRLMLCMHDLWRMLYISVYFYLLPFMVLLFGAGMTHNAS